MKEDENYIILGWRIYVAERERELNENRFFQYEELEA